MLNRYSYLNVIKLSTLYISVILMGCESYSHIPDVIPTSELDRMPAEPKDVSLVTDAVPKYERRTRAGNSSPYKVMGKVYHVNTKPVGYREEGIASWYGEKFHGRRTASGEVYDMYAMTAAHPSLPIPSYVRVTNLENDRKVVVRVNDRGPFHPGRVIDLSFAGASKLDYLKQGTARVSVEYIDTDSLAPGPLNTSDSFNSDFNGAQTDKSALLYYQFGAFSTHAIAEKIKHDLQSRTSLPVSVVSEDSNKRVPSAPKRLHKVHLGPVVTPNDKQEAAELIEALDMPKPLVVYR